MPQSERLAQVDEADRDGVGHPPLVVGKREWEQAELADAVVRKHLTSAEESMVREYFWVLGFKILKKFLRNGEMDGLCRARRRPITFQFDDRRILRQSGNLRDELAAEVLILAVPFFFKELKHWKPDGGASLVTYFVGACVLNFKAGLRKVGQGPT